MRPGPRRQRLFGKSRRGAHAWHNCSRSISDSKTSFGPYVERVRRSGLAPRKCFRSPAWQAADIDVCREPIAAGAVLVPDAFPCSFPGTTGTTPGLNAARPALEIDRHYSGTL